MPGLTDEELAAIRRRCDKATPGPWKSWIEGRDHSGGDHIITTGGEDIYLSGATIPADYDFIAGARQDVRALLAEIDRLRVLIGRN